MDFKQNVSIHNRFDIEVINARTGEIKQRAQAENVILNRLWTALLADNGNRYFGYIFYGSGSGTPAATYKNQIDPQIKHQREVKVLAYSLSSWEEYSKSFNDKEVEVIIEKYDSKKEMYYGHSSNYLDVYIKDDDLNVGDIVKVKYHY